MRECAVTIRARLIEFALLEGQPGEAYEHAGSAPHRTCLVVQVNGTLEKKSGPLPIHRCLSMPEDFESDGSVLLLLDVQACLGAAQKQLIIKVLVDQISCVAEHDAGDRSRTVTHEFLAAAQYLAGVLCRELILAQAEVMN